MRLCIKHIAEKVSELTIKQTETNNQTTKHKYNTALVLYNRYYQFII